MLSVFTLAFATNSSEQTFKSYFQKTFLTQNLTLPEAKRFRTLANAQLSNLNTKNLKSQTIQTQKFIMLLLKIESLFPKNKKYFNSQAQLMRLNISPQTAENLLAEKQFFTEITENLGPLDTIEYIQMYSTSLEKINKNDSAVSAQFHRCELLAELYLTSQFENCLKELRQLSSSTAQLVESQNMYLLRYYFTTSPLHLKKAAILKKEISGYEFFKNNPISLKYIHAVNDLLNLEVNPSNIKMSLKIVEQLLELDFTTRPDLKVTSLRCKAALLLRGGQPDLALQEVAKIKKSLNESSDLSSNPEVNNHIALLELYTQYKLNPPNNNSYNFNQKHLVLSQNICTQNVLSNMTLTLIMQLIGYNKPLGDKIQQETDRCKKYVGLSGQEPQIQHAFDLIGIANQETLDKEAKVKIKEIFSKIKSHLYLINYQDLIVDDLTKPAS